MKTRSSDTPEHFETAPETPQTPELLAAQQEIDHLKAALDDMKILSQIQSGNYAALLNSQTHKEPTVATPSIVACPLRRYPYPPKCWRPQHN